jgi:ribosome-binding factor A
VISDMIRKHVKDPHLPELLTVTEVDVSNDLHYAKVYISVIGTDEDKQRAVNILQKASRMIAYYSNKEVTVRYFPELTFHVDTQLEKQFQIQALLYNIEEERSSRDNGDEDAQANSGNGA